MIRVTYITNPDEDWSLWYKDGEYVGHDDQFDVIELAVSGGKVQIELHRIDAPDGWYFHSAFNGLDLDEVKASVAASALTAEAEALDLYGDAEG